jgi:type I restriction enzyme S subunit
LKYDIDDVRGISILKKLIDTKADMTGVSLSPYKVMNPNEFCYVTVTSRNGGKISLAMNEDDKSYIVSSSYITFRCKDENVLYPRYLYLLLSRSEFDRYSRFNSWGSARETFDWEEMCRVQIPLPDITIQKELVAAYNGLKRLAEENEALIEPLQKTCQAYVVDCKAKYPMVKLGNYIELNDKVNANEKFSLEDVKGISVAKCFIDTKADMDGVSLKSYKVIDPKGFCYVTVTSRNGERISLAYNNSKETYIASSSYISFNVKDENLLSPGYLYILLSRSEFDRLARFNSWGSARETFDWEDMCRVEIPLPPPNVQEAIVNLYHCLEEAKRISSEAREQLKTLCPALVQRASKN